MLKNNKVFYCQVLSKVFYDEINYHKEAFYYGRPFAAAFSKTDFKRVSEKRISKSSDFMKRRKDNRNAISLIFKCGKVMI